MQEDTERMSNRTRLGYRTAGKNSLFQPSSKYVPLSNLEGIRQQKERDGLCLSSAVPKTQWTLTSTGPTTIRLLKTFTFYFLMHSTVTATNILYAESLTYDFLIIDT